MRLVKRASRLAAIVEIVGTRKLAVSDSPSRFRDMLDLAQTPAVMSRRRNPENGASVDEGSRRSRERRPVQAAP